MVMVAVARLLCLGNFLCVWVCMPHYFVERAIFRHDGGGYWFFGSQRPFNTFSMPYFVFDVMCANRNLLVERTQKNGLTDSFSLSLLFMDSKNGTLKSHS